MRRSRCVVVAVYIVMLLVPFSTRPQPAIAQSHYVTEDGGWWESLSQDEQFVAVESGISAIQTAYVSGIDATALIVHPGSYQNYLNLATQADHTRPQFSHTFGYYISAVTDFYVVHANARKALVAAVLDCLADNPVLSCANVARDAQQ
jgi:cystathionine beta-lyase/cystathionine gamma-synthase